ncbi:MAG: hypothetical protein HYW02_06355 [Deltaproteobacteria bacterium]|nr:hypothetical protein [Deltaproteobacteria bacterium]MBI2501073.1 hypothetical protein [Deltaproteobacteria bacterium]MBI4196981.1 hypothetical protein [Deltaproteobacteria bacterium]
MPNILEAQNKVVEFLTHELGKQKESIRIVKMAKTTDGWECKAEITEVNEYLKKVGFPSIFDKNIYTVLLDAQMEVSGFAETESRERTYATEEREEI